MAVSKITIPEQMYLGMLWRENEVPLGFLTPDGTDSAAIKRKQTVDNWVRANERHRSKIPIDKTTVKNELLSGFKLSKSTRRWTTQNVVWRVIDPRGFEIEISSENLMTLIDDTTIINGEILGRLIYGRAAASNVLLHENSEEYTAAVKMTSVVSEIVSMRDVKPGYEVALHNGMTLRYWGYYHTLSFSKQYSETTSHVEKQHTKISDKKTHVFVNESENKIYIAGSPKIGKILDKSREYTSDQAIVELSNMIANQHMAITSIGNGYGHYDIIGFVLSKKSAVTFEYDPVTIEQVEELYYKFQKNGNYHFWHVYALANNSATYCCDYYRNPFGIPNQPINPTECWCEVTFDINDGNQEYLTSARQNNSLFGSRTHYSRKKFLWTDIVDSIISINFIKLTVDDGAVSIEYYIH